MAIMFDDNFHGNNTSNGKMAAITVEHFSCWTHGDNYFFVDLLSRSQSRIYAEWLLRLSFSALSGHDISVGIFKGFFLTAKLNRDGEGFRAEIVGFRYLFNMPGFHLLSSNIYLREDNLNRLTLQSTTTCKTPMIRGHLLKVSSISTTSTTTAWKYILKHNHTSIATPYKP